MTGDAGQLHGWAHYLPLLVVVLVIALRLRGAGRRRPLRLERLWVVPALYLVLVVTLLVETPPPGIGGWLSAAFALAAGAFSDVVLLSARVAAQFGAAVRAGGGPGPQRLWCLSPRIAEAARAAFAPLAPLITASAQPEIAALLPQLQAAVNAQKTMPAKD